MEITVDERHGKPSASAMGRIFHCHGSQKFISGLRRAKVKLDGQIAGEDKPWTAAGNRVHDYMCRQDDESKAALTPDDEWMVRSLFDLLASGREQTGFIGEQLREKRLWSKCGKYSGQMDVGFIDEKTRTASLWDYKTGYVIVDPAYCNMQLRTLAVLMADNYPVDSVYAGIIQPRSDQPLTITRYDRSDLERARDELSELMVQVERPGAALTPGSWCSYCQAKSLCPAYGKQMAMEIATRTDAENVVDLVKQLSPEELASAGALIKRGRSFFDALEARIKESLLADPNSIPGFMITPGAKTSHISDTQKAFELLSGYIGAEKFASCCDVSLSKLDSAYHDATRGRTKKASKAELRSILQPVIVNGTKSGSLKRIEDDSPEKMAIEQGEA